MANTGLSMRKIKDVLRLTTRRSSEHAQVPLSLNISRSTVKNYQQRAQKAGLSWPLPEDSATETVFLPAPLRLSPASQQRPNAAYEIRRPRHSTKRQMGYRA
jgi:hypothetical protein